MTSNTNTGSLPADPYKQANVDTADLKTKVQDLIAFCDKCKFCMMATRTSEGLLASRCMALAGKVSAQ